MSIAPATSPLLERARHLRELLASHGPLAGASIGTVPILWNNVDFADLRLGTGADAILDDIARTGYDGCQLGFGFPEGETLRSTLAARELRLAEVYASIPATPDGPTAGALDHVRERLRLLVAGGGEVFCVALDGSAGRDAAAGHATDADTPALSDAGWEALFALIRTVSTETREAGARIAFHPHAGTFVETPAEVDRLLTALDADTLPLCLDVGHYLVGGGDPVDALRRYGDRVKHVHLKDVDPHLLGRLRSREIGSFSEAVRQRLFTELGSGALDLDGILAELATRRYDGWLMVEQDSGWPPPAESAAIGRRVLAAALRRLDPPTSPTQTTRGGGR
ncbi:MAG TPA: sugar phosphate isomerase/epimerase [Candidatus Bathyarchaeia archaeon]|nr:sugar phosphate isomerase/epimerase [Candidatus Bathyarchaeia archaeon]